MLRPFFFFFLIYLAVMFILGSLIVTTKNSFIVSIFSGVIIVTIDIKKGGRI